MKGESPSVFAAAKVNLALHVCGKRADGYHLLDSLVSFCEIGDRVTVAPADALTLALTGAFAGDLKAEPDNLVLKAARLLAAKAGVAPRAAITLEKNLPIASGIGGGSADAAATLIACGELWGVDPAILSTADVTGLGADVPVCLKGESALMRGIGEDLTAAVLPSAYIVLANPRRPLATKAVFGALNGRFGGPLEPLPSFANAAALADYLGQTRNDLTAPAAELMPEIREVLSALDALPGCLLARLSGSGPTCFGLFADGADAYPASSALRKAHKDWWVTAGSLGHALR
jgi:4-diphosphocytidyl-2-C-methyl-D-erythritol kinase